jgi:2-amino-4-hydroxy-6-hydroxymethyldihydropteridine diphosphokinase
MNDVYLLIGANLGNKEAQIQEACSLIHAEIGLIFEYSSLYESESWGGVGDQPTYLNQVLKIGTDLSPTEVLQRIHAIEYRLGRVRTLKWGSRVIDIDILFYGDLIVDLPDLSIPHLHFHNRNFAMLPMAELAPNFTHPRLGVTVRELLEASTDPLNVWIHTNESQ